MRPQRYKDVLSNMNVIVTHTISWSSIHIPLLFWLDCCGKMNAKSISELPTEIWTMILSINKYPNRFNYRNVNCQFRSIIDRCKMGLVVDVDRYYKLNQVFAVDRQIDYIINDICQVIKGLIINNTSFSEFDQPLSNQNIMLSIMQTVVNNQAHQLDDIVLLTKQINFKIQREIISLIGRCYNLKSLDTNMDTKIDLSNHPALQVLKGTNYANFSSAVNIISLNFSAHLSNPDDFLQMLSITSSRLEILVFSITYHSNKNDHSLVFRMPSLRTLIFNNEHTIVVDISQSFHLRHVEVVHNSVDDIIPHVVGWEVQKHRFRYISLPYHQYGNVVSSLLQAPPQFHNQLEHLNVAGEVPFQLACDIIDVLSYNCTALQHLAFEKLEDDCMADLSSLERLLSGAPNLKYLKLRQIRLKKEWLINLIILKASVDLEIEFQFSNVVDCDFGNFTYDLLHALKQLELKRRQHKFSVVLVNGFMCCWEENNNFSDALIQQFNIVVDICW